MHELLDQRRVIICFSPADRRGKELLAVHLAAARRSIRAWSVDDASPGEETLPAFMKEAERAAAALLLLSANFMNALGDPMFARQVEELCRQQRQRGMWIDALIWRPFLFDGFFELTGLKLPCGQMTRYRRNALSAMSSARRDEAVVELVETLFHAVGIWLCCAHFEAVFESSTELVVRREYWSAISSIVCLRVWMSLLAEATMPQLTSGPGSWPRAED